MNTQNEVVFDFEQTEVIRSHKKQTKHVVAVLYLLHIACSLTALFLSFISVGVLLFLAIKYILIDILTDITNEYLS